MQTAQLLEQLYNGKTLNKEESAVIFNAIMQGELNNEQIAAMLIALKVRGATIDELSGAVSASLQNANHSLVLTTLCGYLWGLVVDGQNIN